jgi:hypothetical protein
MSRLRGALGAFAIGFIVGVLGLATEWTLSDSQVRVQTITAYGLLSGFVAAGIHAIVALRGRRTPARLAALAASAPMLAFQLGYAINVRLLPGEHYSSLKSLAADVVVLVPIALALLRAGNSRFANSAREALGGTTALAGAALLASSVVTLASTWPSPPKPVHRGGSGTDLVLVVMDSVRRDRLGVYGHSRPTSPRLDALAKEATVFDSAESGGAWTVPSVRVLLQKDADSRVGLAESLAARGYVTACFTDNPHLVPAAPVLEGFDHIARSVGTWRQIIAGTLASEVLERLAPGNDEDLVQRALEWAGAQRGPFFLYVHLMDSHTPYRFPEIDGRPRPGRRVEFPMSHMQLTPDEADGIRARYEGGIRSTDAAVGRLLDSLLQRRGILAIVTADHGESLGEDGRWFHGEAMTQERLAVPLLVFGGGARPARVRTPVGFQAIPAALLAASGGLVAGTILDPAAPPEAALLWQGPATVVPATENPAAGARERLRALGYIGYIQP